MSGTSRVFGRGEELVTISINKEKANEIREPTVQTKE